MKDVVLCTGAVVPHWDAARVYCTLNWWAGMAPDGTDMIRFLQRVALLPGDARREEVDAVLAASATFQSAVKFWCGDQGVSAPEWRLFFDESGGMKPAARAGVLACVRGTGTRVEVGSPFTTEWDETIAKVIQVRDQLGDQLKGDPALAKLIWRHLDGDGLTRDDLAARDRRERWGRGPDDLPGPSRN